MASLVRVSPKLPEPSHHISLSDGRKTIGLILDGGPRGIQEIPQTPSTLRFTDAGGKYGDFEPGMSHLEQADWTGGRGQERFVDDASRFFDSQGMWTLTPGHLLPGPLQGTGTGAITSSFMPATRPQDQSGDIGWAPLLSSTRYIATVRNGGAFTADYIIMYVRRVGSPGTLTFELQGDSSGAPDGTALKSVTKTVSDITDPIGSQIVFDWSTTQALSAATSYWAVLYGASTDTLENHWEVGVSVAHTTLTNGKTSSNGSTWATTAVGVPYYSYSPTGDARKIFFELDGLVYSVDNQAGTATNLFMHGYRGKSTDSTATTLRDTNQAFTADELIGGTVKIINGTGIGQTRTITDNDTDSATVATWDTTPDDTSEWIIYGVPNVNPVTGHGLGNGLVTSVCVVDRLPGIAYFAQGSATNMRRMRFDATAAPPAHGFAADGTNKADLLYTFWDLPSKTMQVWRAINGTTVQIARAASVAWGTDLTFGTTITGGKKQYSITGFCDHGGVLYFAKEDVLYRVENDFPVAINVGLRSSPHPNNGSAIISSGLFLYFSYMHSLERLYGTTLDDIGPWRGSGIPSGRTGIISSLQSAWAWIFAAVDAGTGGTSSVLLYDGRNWHEIFRGFAVGKRIRSIHFFAGEGARPRLWIECGHHFYYLDFPLNTLNPLSDSTFKYTHEGALITSTFDTGSVRLPKFFKELSAATKNLTVGTEVRVEYQTDADIGTTTWTSLGTFYQVPIDTLSLNLGNVRQIRFRIRLITDDADVPPDVMGTVLEGYARTPLKYQYVLRVKVQDNALDLLGNPDADADDKVYFLKDCARGAKKVLMRSIWEQLDNIYVVVEPPTIIRQFTDTILRWWGGWTTITVREA